MPGLSLMVFRNPQLPMFHLTFALAGFFLGDGRLSCDVGGAISELDMGRSPESTLGKIYDAVLDYHGAAAQQAAANAVSELNAALPSDRVPWSPESLGKFFAAFIDLRKGAERNDVLATPVLPEKEIIAFIMRDVKIEGEARERLEQLLLKQCSDLIDVIPHAYVYVRAGTSAAADGPKGLVDGEVPVGAFGRFLVRPARAVAGFGKAIGKRAIGRTGTLVATAREYAVQQKVAAEHVLALRAGGLSTKEIREILVLHRLDEKLIDAALKDASRPSGDQ